MEGNNFEELFSLIMENSRDMISIHDMEGNYICVSQSSKSLLGYEPSELTGHNSYEYIHPEDIPSIEKHHGDTKRNIQKEKIEYRIRKKDGSFIWFESLSKTFRDRKGNDRIIVTSRDISERKNLEDSLRESERKYKNLYHYANVGLFETSLNDATIIACNKVYCELAGFSSVEEAIGQDVAQFYVNPQDREEVKRILREKGYIEHYILELKNKITGKKFWTEFNAMINPERDVAEGTIIDITTKKEAEAEKNLLLSIIESTSDLVATAKVDSEISYINNSGLNLLKWPDDWKKREYKIPNAHPPGKVDIIIKEGIPRAIKHGIWHGETAILTSDGKEIPVSQVIMSHKNYDGTLEHISTIIRDISDIKRAEKELFTEKERLMVTLKSIGDGVIATDIHGRITLMNIIAEELTGWTMEEAIGKPLSSVFYIVNEITGEKCENPVDKVLQTGYIVELANHTALISRDGKKFILADSGAPIKDKEGNIIGVILVFRDITEKQKIMDHLQKTQKLDSLGLLAGGIAHDFNNLLGGIFGYLELAMECCTDEEVNSYLSGALKVFTRAKSLTQQLLTFARGGAPLKKISSPGPVIKDTVTFALTGSSISPEFEIDDHLWHCNFDENQIGQVIDNIVINAYQAMPFGGKIFVRAENIDVLKDSHVSLKEGKYVKISIKDEGIGIPKEFIHNIFDPFFTTKQKGSGLGLAITYSIIQKHDGLIEVISEDTKGTTFIIYLPASMEYLAHGVSPEFMEYRGTGTILIMDDEDHMREVMSRMLKKMGYSTVCAKNGEDAVNIFKDPPSSTYFSAVLLDLTIPGGMGGKDVVKELLEIKPDIKAIAISGYSEDPVMAEPEEYGFIAGLKKPFLKRDLQEVLKVNNI